MLNRDSRNRSAVGRIAEDLGPPSGRPRSRPPTIRINPCLAAAVPDGVDVQRLCCAVRGERAWLLRAVPQDSARPQPAALCDRSALPRAAIPAAATAV